MATFPNALTSCSDDIDVQQSYPFTVEIMPYGEKVSKGETVELQFNINPEGNYANTLYTVRYFQYDGDGELQIAGGPILSNNNRVLLDSKSFSLNYTANSSGAHKFLVVIEDNSGSQPWEKTFEFNGASGNDSTPALDDDDPGWTITGFTGHVPVNPLKPLVK